MTVDHTETTLRAPDGKQLFFQRWQPSGEDDCVADVLVIHGYGEHGGRYRELAHCLARAGIATSALDLRGHGHSVGKRGHIDAFDEYLDDVTTGMSNLEDRPLFLLGHSNGGLVALDFVASKKPKISGLILSNPFLALAMDVPAIKVWIANAASQLFPRLALPTGLKASDVSRDPAIVDSYARDPLVFGTATVRWLTETQNAQRRVRALQEIEGPLFYAYSDSDPIASSSANRQLAERLGSPDKTVSFRPGGLHEILNEIDRAELHEEIRGWIGQHC